MIVFYVVKFNTELEKVIKCSCFVVKVIRLQETSMFLLDIPQAQASVFLEKKEKHISIELLQVRLSYKIPPSMNQGIAYTIVQHRIQLLYYTAKKRNNIRRFPFLQLSAIQICLPSYRIHTSSLSQKIIVLSFRPFYIMSNIYIQEYTNALLLETWCYESRATSKEQ